MFHTKPRLKSRYRIIILALAISFIIAKGVFAESRSGYGNPLATYKAAEGFIITSYATKWNTSSKLREVANELLSNEYGEEISSLRNIYIYPDSPDGILAYTHYDLIRNYLGKYTYTDHTYIEIFDGNQYNNTKEMAWVLSHEYGHHFTIYHLIKKENKFFDQWQNTGYAMARQIVGHPKISYETDAIGNMYKWDIMEIAAEDYVQFFGSPNARRSIIYKDIRQKIYEDRENKFNDTTGFNMRPQENLEIPLAADVRGLEQYWRSVSRLPKQTSSKVPIKPKLRIVSKKEIASGRYQYRIEWDQIPGNEQYEYTLVSYPDREYAFPHPIKTIRPGEDTYAIVGNGLKTNPKTGTQQLILNDYNGRHTFKLYMKDQNNKIYSGESLYVNFNYPVIEHKGLYKDTHHTDWSYEAIKQLNKRKILVGSPDQYFYPLKSVTYSEFLTILGRIDGKVEIGSFPMGNPYVTRDDAALLLYKYMKTNGISLNDINKNLTFKDYNDILNKREVEYLYKTGIIVGDNGYYYPKNNITRQELASMIIRLLKG